MVCHKVFDPEKHIHYLFLVVLYLNYDVTEVIFSLKLPNPQTVHYTYEKQKEKSP